jgi:hypothetical protein
VREVKTVGIYSRSKRIFARPYLKLIALFGVIVPRRLRADWRQEWEAELRHRETLLAEWERLGWRSKIDLSWRSTSAFWDALWLQSKRWENEMIQDIRFALRMLFRLSPGINIWCGDVLMPACLVYPGRTGAWGCGVVLANMTGSEARVSERLGCALERISEADVVASNDPAQLTFRVIAE